MAESFEGTSVVANNHLTVISADEDLPGGLGPSVAREVLGDLATLFRRVDLGKLSIKVALSILANVFKGVAGASQQDRVALDIEGIERDLEHSRSDAHGDVQANRQAELALVTVPVPKNHLPVGRATQRHDDVFLAHRESGADHLLRLEFVALILGAGQCLEVLRADDLKNGEQTFLALRVTLAHSDVLTVVGDSNMGDGFGALSA